MRLLIAVATKKGFTLKCANALADELRKRLDSDSRVDVVNLAEVDGVNLDGYDGVVVGGPVYAGSILKGVKEFCAQNRDALMARPLGLFTCGLGKDDGAREQLEKVYPAELLSHAVARESLGGALIYEEMFFLMRIFLRKLTKIEKSYSRVEEDAVQSVAD